MQTLFFQLFMFCFIRILCNAAEPESSYVDYNKDGYGGVLDAIFDEGREVLEEDDLTPRRMPRYGDHRDRYDAIVDEYGFLPSRVKRTITKLNPESLRLIREHVASGRHDASVEADSYRSSLREASSLSNAMEESPDTMTQTAERRVYEDVQYYDSLDFEDD